MKQHVIFDDLNCVFNCRGEGGDVGFHRAMTSTMTARQGAQDEDGGKEEAVGGGGALALAMADDGKKRRGERGGEGLVQANVGHKVTLLRILSLRLFLYLVLLHMISL
jgi:hypothetical protein